MTMAAIPRPTNDDRIRAALWFAEHGFGVFPCWSTTDDGTCRCPQGAACNQSGKHPITQHGFKEATRDPERIRTFLSAASDPNYGLVCPDGVFALDVDGDGVEKLVELEARYGQLPDTLRTETANGWHYFLRWPDTHPRPLGQMFGYIARWGTGKAAGYVIGPRSIHKTGKVYLPAGVANIATLPETWAAAAVTPDTSTITVTGPRPADEVEVGQRHIWLRNRARWYAGTIRDPDVLFAAVWAENEKLSQPKNEADVRQAIGEALRFPKDDVEEDPETGAQRRVADDGDMLADDPRHPFPEAPPREAFGGLLGDAVAELLPGTDASEVGLLASLLAFCGVLVPALGYSGRTHTTSPFIALVGESTVGRKGTAMTRVQEALEGVFGTTVINRVLLDGVNSGEGLVTALENKQLHFKQEPTVGLLFEEEYRTLMEAAGREGSSLDSRIRVAFDGSQMSNRKGNSTQVVTPPYWVAALVGITPNELQDKGPAGSLTSGYANRWLWVPVRQREEGGDEQPYLSEPTRRALRAAYEVSRTPETLRSEAKGILAAYARHLSENATGLAVDLSRRYTAIAFRIGMIHAAVERSPVVTEEHAYRGICLTEYAREGVPWAFGFTVGNELATLILRHLLEVGSLTRRQITQDWARDPVKRQRALDELRRLGFAEVVKVVGTGGRPKAELRLIRERARFVRFVRSVPSVHPVQGPSARNARNAQNAPNEGNAQNARNKAETPAHTPCSDPNAHRRSRHPTVTGWVCDICEETA